VRSLLEFLLVGVALGAVYGLIAIPLSLVWSTTRTLDLAAGGYAVLGGLTGAVVGGPLGAVLAIGLGVLFGSVMGIIYLALQRRPGGNPLSAMLASVGLLFALVSITQWRLGADPHFSPWLEGVWSIGGIRIRVTSLLNLAIVLVMTAIVMLVLYRTRAGRWIRACATSPRNARLVGVPVTSVQFSAFALSGAVSALAGLLLVSSRGLSFDLGMPLALLGLGALIIFGMRGTAAGVAGGMVLGVVESLSAGYLPSEVAPIIPLAFILAVLASGAFDVRIGEARP
jgi:branched-chain amino acid transport system permease protein